MGREDEFDELHTSEDEFDAMWRESTPVGASHIRRAGQYWTLDAISGAAVRGLRAEGARFSLTAASSHATAATQR